MKKVAAITSITPDLPTGKKVTIRGVKSLINTKFFEITYDGKTGFVPQSMFVPKKNEAREMLLQQGALITSNKDWGVIIQSIESIRGFVKEALAETSGWAAGYFAGKGGTVISPPGAPKGRAIFKRKGSGPEMKGTHRDWLAQVAQPLTGQHMPMIAVLSALASPMLKFSGETQNFGIEFCGPPGTGKTTCLQLAASIAGNPTRIPTFNATRAGLETMFAEHHDLPFPVDEANLVDDRDRNTLKDFAFRMANGTVKVTAYQPDRAQYRFIFVTTANRPFHEGLRDFSTDTAGAALQRLLPLKIPTDSGLGVFGSIPEGFASSGAFADYLREATFRLYGTPMQRILRELVVAQARNPTKFRELVLDHIRRLEVEVGVAETRLGKSRASSAFGLLNAAGSFAVAKGILPRSWDCLAACAAGYRNYQAQLPEQTPLIARLTTIAMLPATLDLRVIAPPNLTDADVERHGAFLTLGVRGRTELLLTETMRVRFFSDWATLQNTAEFIERNLRDKDHITKQRHVRLGRQKERFVCFTLPEVLVATKLPQASLPHRNIPPTPT